MKRNKLEKKRKEKGLTQSDVALKVGICRGYYSNIENGKKRCSVSTWLKIAECLSIPKEEIIFYIEEGLQKGA